MGPPEGEPVRGSCAGRASCGCLRCRGSPLADSTHGHLEEGKQPRRAPRALARGPLTGQRRGLLRGARRLFPPSALWARSEKKREEASPVSGVQV
jgi:hypothetical protein